MNPRPWPDPRRFIAAPTRQQVKDIYWRDIKSLVPSAWVSNISETELSIVTKWGAELRLIGLDKPERMEGIGWDGGTIDEYASCFVAGTMVGTPTGPKAIETLRPGDVVHNAIGNGVVRGIIRKTSDLIAVVKVQGYTMVSSIDHRYLTTRGWVEARHLEQGDSVVKQDAAVRIMRRDVPPLSLQPGATVLQPQVLGVAHPQDEARRDLQWVPQAVRGEVRCAWRAAEVLQPCVPPRGEQGQPAAARDAGVLRVRGGRGPNLTEQAAAFLQSVLLREVEDDATGDPRGGVYAGTGEEVGRIPSGLLGDQHAGRARKKGRAPVRQHDAHRSHAGEAGNVVAGHWAQAGRAGRERFGNDAPAGRLAAGVGGGVQGGVLRAERPRSKEGRTPAALHARHCRAGTKGERGNRRGVPQLPQPAGVGRAEDGHPDFARVDGVEILQSGDRRFGEYGGGEGSIRLYDLEVSGHPSFSVNGFIVHNCRRGLYDANVRPAIADRRGGVDLIGVPDFAGPAQDEYRQFCDLGESGTHPEWADFAWGSAGILPEEEIASMRASMDPRLFEQETTGKFIVASGLAFPDFDPKVHAAKPCDYDPALPICWSLDFNVNPLCSGVIQHVKGEVRVIDEFELPDTVTPAAVTAFLDRAKQRGWDLKDLCIYGDASGNARRTTADQPGMTDWILVRNGMNAAGVQFRMKVPNRNPALQDTRNAVNAKLRNAEGKASLFLSPRCRRLVTDLRSALWPSPDDWAEAHCLAWLRYFVAWEYPVRSNQTAPASPSAVL